MKLIDRILDYKNTAYYLAMDDSVTCYYVNMHLKQFHDKIQDKRIKQMNFELMVDSLFF